MKALSHDRIITPGTDPDRFTEEEAAAYRAGKCGWQVEYGNVGMTKICGARSKRGASFGNCAGHEAELLEDFHNDGSHRVRS